MRFLDWSIHMDFSVVLAAAAAVNRLVESLVKPTVRKLPYSVEVQDGIIVFVALLAGIAVALMGNLSLFTGVPAVPTFAALLLTGAVIGLGADLIHIVIDFLYGWRDVVRPTEGAVLALEAGDMTTNVTVNTPAPSHAGISTQV
jgi:hypothetical protein